MTNVATPLPQQDRTYSLDILRGIAVMGILVMNIQSFSMVFAAYMNPTAYGDLTGINYWVWHISSVLANEKFYAIFSMLFGAGMVVMMERMEGTDRNFKHIHYRRMMWLMLIGMLHGYLIWYGDILFAYAVSGMVLYTMRNVRTKNLVIFILAFISIPMLLMAAQSISMSMVPESDKVEMMKMWKPSAEVIQEYINNVHAGYLADTGQRVGQYAQMQLMMLFFMWRLIGIMLIGVILYRTGIIKAEKSVKFYVVSIIIALPIGLGLSEWGIQMNEANQWSMDYSQGLGGLPNAVGSLFTAYGYICIVMLLCNGGAYQWLKSRVAPVGQMALSNYLSHSIICSFIFGGWGLGYFGLVERSGQIMIVAGIIAMQLLWSKWWLTHYRFGPFEWLWRSLTYGKLQPLKK